MKRIIVSENLDKSFEILIVYLKIIKGELEKDRRLKVIPEKIKKAFGAFVFFFLILYCIVLFLYCCCCMEIYLIKKNTLIFLIKKNIIKQSYICK